MGDRTSVTLYVLPVHAERALEILEPFNYKACSDSRKFESHEKNNVFFVFEEVNYGELQGLDVLCSEGIAYDSCWNAGSDYGAGLQYLRFDSNGHPTLQDVYDDYINPDLTALMGLIDSPAELREYIIKHSERVAIPNWVNQEQNGKIYRTKQLINPK